MFRSRSNDGEGDTERLPRARPSRTAQSLIVAGTAIATAVVLLVTGALDDRHHVELEAATTTTVANAPATPPADSVMMKYLRDMKAWTDCMKATTPTGSAPTTTQSCGAAPKQPDDARLNAYLSTVLEWNKCAAPRLRAGGVEAAEVACGPQPVSPLGS